MNDTEQQQRQGGEGRDWGGDRRRRDRRSSDRRQEGRRKPPPPWRRPWAYVAYGVVGMLVVFMLFGMNDDEPQAAVPGEVVEGTRSVSPSAATPPASERPIIDAYTVAEYQRLIAEGEAAEGQRVNGELFCRGINSIALRDVDQMNASIADLADSAARVPAAECRWGDQAGGGEDFLLIVPPELAEQFAAAPRVTERFLERRHIRGMIEWVGRSDALALRTSGVLREIH